MKKFTFISFAFAVFILSLCLFSCKEAECRHKNMSSVTSDATCTEAGMTVFTCVDCQYTYNDDIVSPMGHSYEKNVIAPTCEQGGYTEYSCSCGYSYVSDHTDAKGHDFREIVNAPDCENTGFTLYVCKTCDFTYSSDAVKPIGHKLTSSVTSPTCEDEGFTTYKCSNCSFEYISDKTEPKGHNISEIVTAPTCLENGYTTFSCSDCSFQYVSNYTEALTHDFSESVTPPTCTENGYTTFSCNSCDFSYTADITPTLSHDYSSEVLTEVNCVDSGEIRYTCACGDSYSEFTRPQGHVFEALVTMPTLSDMGYTEFNCTNCDYSYIGDYRFYSDIVSGAFSDQNDAIAKGIDISVYNHEFDANGAPLPIDWAAVASEGIDYVILKAGSTWRNAGLGGGMDLTFEMDYLGAKEAGLDVGVYFYTYALSVEEIRNDAYMLLSILDGKRFEYPIYLDLEDDSLRHIDKATLSEMCVEFFSILQSAGYYTGLYVNHEWLYNVIDTDIALSKFDIWYARYSGDDGIWNSEDNGDPFGMWQYTDQGALSSFGSIPVDINMCYKDYPSIIVEGGFNGYESNVRFPDDGVEFVWVSANFLTVRSSDDFDSVDNIIAYASFGDRFTVIEKLDGCIKISYLGREAYISANLNYVSFSPVW